MSQFDTHGGYFAPKDYFKVNEGGTHEENPNGGVQVGMDPQGIPNMLEEGEPAYKDYVFSDNIIADKKILEEYKIPEKFAGMLYSKIADSYVDEAVERPNDPISREGLNAMLLRLADAQEAQKQQEEQRALEAELAEMSPEEIAALEQMMNGADSQASGEPTGIPGVEGMTDPAMAQQVPVEQAPMQQPMIPMACGGFIRRYAGGGEGDVVFDPERRMAYMPGYDNGTELDLYANLDPSRVVAYPGKTQAWVDAETSGIKKKIAEGSNQFLADAYEYYDHNPAAKIITGIAMASGPGGVLRDAEQATKNYKWTRYLLDPATPLLKNWHPEKFIGKGAKGLAHAAIDGTALVGESAAIGKGISTGADMINNRGDAPVGNLFSDVKADGGPINRYWPGGPVRFGQDNTQAFRNAYPGAFGQIGIPDYLHYGINIPGGEIQHGFVSADATEPTSPIGGPIRFGQDNIQAFQRAFPGIFGNISIPDYLHYSVESGNTGDPDPAASGSVGAVTTQKAVAPRTGWIGNPAGINAGKPGFVDFNKALADLAVAKTNGPGIIDNRRIGDAPQVSTGRGSGAAALSTMPMYAGAIGSGLLSLQSALQRPDRYDVPRVVPQLPYGDINLQNERYDPIDQNMIANSLIAQGNATARGLRNSGLGASSAIAQLAADRNLGQNLGAGFIQGWQANNQQRNAVLAANNQAEAQRAQFDYGIDAARKNALNQAAMQNARYNLLGQQLNNEAEGQKYQAVSANLSNALQALSNIGRQNFIMNQINSNRALYDQLMPNGVALYDPWAKYGGYIKKLKK